LFQLRLLSRTAIVALLGLTVGCGGGGDEIANLVITAQNAETSASQGVGAVDMLMSMGDLVDDFSDSIENQGALLIPCDEGNVNIGVTDVGLQQVLSTGDSVTVDFQACSFVDDDAVMNGGMSFTATEVTDLGGGMFTLSLTVQFSALTIVNDEGTMVVNGGFTSTLSSADGVTVRQVISGSNFSVFAEGDGEVFSGSIRGFSLVREIDTGDDGFLVDFDATVSGGNLNGQVVYNTTIPFEGTGDGDPQTGSMILRGANGGTITMVMTGEGNVDLLIDFDGDNTTDLTIPTTWDELTDDEISGSDL